MTHTLDKTTVIRLQFLTRVVRKECQHLITTDQRLFHSPFDRARAIQLETNPELSEQVEAVVGRFSRLQGTIGDKLLPLFLAALNEKVGAVIDNLDKAERLGLLDSTDEWISMRQIRNQMVHEYVEDLSLLIHALQTAHLFVETMVGTANKLLADIEQRGLLRGSISLS